MRNKKYHIIIKVNKLFLSLAVVALLLALTWTFGRLVEPARASALQQGLVCDEVYTVQQGDWLSKIAEKYYGDPLAYDRLVIAANTETGDVYTDISDPNLIEPGWVVCITSVDVVASLADLAATAPPGLSPQELANATYKSQYTISPTVTLQNGRYSEPAAPGSATETVIIMTRNLAYGDMNGEQSAAVVLVSNPGGSGTFYDLHLMFAPQGQAVNPATAFLGDRVQINDVKIENSLIVVDMVQAGPNDPMCCPSQHVIKSYSWEKDNLVEVSSEVVADSAAEPQLVGPVWQWQKSEMTDGMVWEPPDPASYTIEFTAEGEVSIQADCNKASGGYTSDGSSLTITLGPMTLAACPPQSLSDEYLAQLGAAAHYSFQEGELLIDLQNGSGRMYFSTAGSQAGGEGTGANVPALHKTWQWEKQRDPNTGSEMTISNPANYTLTFNADGTYQFRADCNQGSGSYTADETGAIRFQPGPVTLAECGPDSRYQDMLNMMQSVQNYRLEENEAVLVLSWPAGGPMDYYRALP
jgi:heat shock protein HslJ